MTRKEIEKMCKKRMKAGKAKYGEFDPAKYKGDLIEETLEELIDAINYLRMLTAVYDEDESSYTVRDFFKLMSAEEQIIETIIEKVVEKARK